MSKQQIKDNSTDNKKKKPNWFLRCSILFILIFAITPIGILFLVSDSYALVEETATVNADSATKAKNTFKEVYTHLTSTDSIEPSKITLSENDINGVTALAIRGFKNIKGRVNVTPVGIIGAFSIQTSQNPFGNYINLSATVTPSSYGLYIDEISIGSLHISGETGLSMAEKLLNFFLSGDAIGTQLISSIQSIQVNNANLTIAYTPIPSLKEAITKTKGKVKNIRNDLTILAKPNDVFEYYQNLCEFHYKIGDLGNVPLAFYLSNTFTFASQRTQLSNEPQTENKAALLALSIFLGAAEFDSFIGAIDEATFEKCQPKEANIVLAKRNDLRLHFIFSAALKIISDSSISFAIGEFKELLDSGKGGTGFSFTDIAADRSGIRFAEFALNKSSAFRLQRIASNLTNEDFFFPALQGLRDGISEKDVASRGGIDGQYYKEQLAIIDQRIDDLALYK